MPSIDEARFAENYGFAYAFLKSNKELYGVFKDAVKHNYTADQFVAKVRGTGWFRQHSESYRRYEVLKSTDPATLNQRKATLISKLRDSAAEMGASPSATVLARLAENALRFAWDDSQIRDTLSSYVRSVNGVYGGEAQDTVTQLKQTAWKNGMRYSESTYEKWAQSVAAGAETMQRLTQTIRGQAKTLAPAYAQELDNGQDLYDVASPYIQAKAKILERNPADVDLFDSDIRGALSATGPDGKPASTSLWAFEQSMRKKPDWLNTKNAQDTINGVAHRVISDMFGGA